MESDNFKRWKKVNINQGREEDKYHKSGDRQDTQQKERITDRAKGCLNGQ